MSSNPAIVEVQDNSEEIKKAIKILPLKEKIKAVALYSYLQQKKKLDLEMERDMKILQKKYESFTAPLFRRANEIIEGQKLPDEEELKELDTYLKEEEIAIKNQALTQEPLVGYWYKALKNSEIIAQEIQDKDEPVLKYLTKIEYLAAEQGDDFTLVFIFDTNDYFTNSTLKKHFFLKNGENPVKSEGTLIEWKEGKNVTKKTVKKRQKNKRTGMQRVVAQEVDSESFFNFFKSINLEDREAVEKLEPEEMDRLAERMDIDYDMVRMIIDEIIPYSLEYYLGVKVNDDYDDIDDIQPESSDDSDEEEDDKKDKKKAGEKGEKHECKQQ